MLNYLHNRSYDKKVDGLHLYSDFLALSQNPKCFTTASHFNSYTITHQSVAVAMQDAVSPIGKNLELNVLPEGMAD